MDILFTAIEWPPPQSRLAPDEIDLWWFPLAGNGQERGQARRERLDHLLRHTLAAYVGRPAVALPLSREGRGRPFLDLPGAPDFNLSDTVGGSLLALAGSGRIGVDLERTDRPMPATELARRYFAPDEADALAGMDDESRRLAFLRLWTAKEAACKATGTGLSGQLAAWQFDPLSASPRLLAVPEAAGRPADWHFLRIAPAPGYTAVVASWRMAHRIRQCLRVTPPMPGSDSSATT